jgi:hypothetical protein
MAISTVVKTKRDGTLTFQDGSGVPNTLTVEYEAGDFNLSIPGATVVDNLDRGSMVGSLRYSDDAPMTASFTAYLRDLGDAAYATLEEIILASGDVGANWESTLGPDAEVFTLDLQWEIVEPGGLPPHTLQLERCVVTGSLSEGDPDQISISITSYALYPSVS